MLDTSADGAVAFDGRNSVPLQPNVGQVPSNCSIYAPIPYYRYDQKGRRTAGRSVTIDPETCNDLGWTANIGYDAENHTVSYVNDDFNGTYPEPLSSNSHCPTIRWNPQGHPVFMNCGVSQTLHYDGDQLLFVSNAQGGLDALTIEDLGSVLSDNSIAVNDRDYAGMTVMQHGRQFYSSWDARATIARYKNSPTVGDIVSGSNGAAALAPQLFSYWHPDGFESPFGTVQGVRVADHEGWTTPDAYAGSVHDPMSQKPYMWNRNNPYLYSDPSGYCAFAQPQTCVPSIVPWVAVGIRAAAAAAGGATAAALAGVIGVLALGGDDVKGEHHVPLSPEREKHIVEGDETGGGHAPGTGKAGKSEFPDGWSNEEIVKEVRGIADDPTVNPVYDKGDYVKETTRNGVNIRVIIRPGKGIWTAYPTNTPRNPKQN